VLCAPTAIADDVEVSPLFGVHGSSIIPSLRYSQSDPWIGEEGKRDLDTPLLQSLGDQPRSLRYFSNRGQPLLASYFIQAIRLLT